MTEIGFLKTTNGDEIKITKDMLEDFYVISRIYNIPVKDLIYDMFEVELIHNIEL